ncbi:MAG TPA: lytic murein transglycosylase [Burkholderiaceae bacterium]|nr:lytic murein transglycosylase [Burkholderiaceae bacterium]
MTLDPVRPISCAASRLRTALLVFMSGCAAQTPVAPAASVLVASAPSGAPALSVARAPSAASASTNPEDVAVAFASWIAAFRLSARAAGIGDATLDTALTGVQFRPHVIELDRSQPEFTRTTWDYLDATAGPQRVSQGQATLAQARVEAAAAEARYGVPASVLVAVWGIESNYGSNTGDIPTIDALATLGFEGRRADWARAELLAALKILQDGDIERGRMVGSWAGAMGQAQLLPSSFLAYAVDADGDGRRDIWGSVADVLATTANFLARTGWRADEPWAVEVQLPGSFDVARADSSVREDAGTWGQDGVRAFGGAELPPMHDAAILLPAGARDPAFMVGADFRALLRYNASTNYALAVGLLAQQIAGGVGVQAPWPRDLATLSRPQLIDLQTALSQHGFDSGQPDGVMGPATRNALRQFQRSIGLVPDGYPTLDLLQRLAPP